MGGFLERILSAFKPKGAAIHELPDRVLLERTYLPAIARDGGRILFVGCRRYTAGYYRVLEAHGGEVWTTDIVDKVARFGRRGRHRTGDICEADSLFAGMNFDAVICNGVLGYGVDSEPQQRRALEAISRILKPGGRLLVGWNTDKIADPIAGGLTGTWFTPAPLGDQPPRVAFAEVTHVYDSFTRETQK